MGAGKNGVLLISDNSRPMDHFSFSFEYKFFKFSFFTSVLDPFEMADSLAIASRSNLAKRYLTAHRLDLKLFNRLYFGITESVLYGGPERDFEMAFLNPFIFYHGVQLNDETTGNTVGSVEFALYPWENWAFWGELLIDDIQLEKTGPGDLEPNEIGMTLGIQIADPLNLNGTNLWLEYTRITNRTYNTPNPWEKFLHRRKPIGYFLGNDFDQWEFNISRWFTKDLQISLGYERVRKGEGRIEKEWDAPWFNYTLEQGYSEPFPTGIVERTNSGKFEILYQPSADWRFYLFGRYSNIRNFNNSEGENDSQWIIKAGAWVEGEWVRNVQ